VRVDEQNEGEDRYQCRGEYGGEYPAGEKGRDCEGDSGYGGDDEVSSADEETPDAACDSARDQGERYAVPESAEPEQQARNEAEYARQDEQERVETRRDFFEILKKFKHIISTAAAMAQRLLDNYNISTNNLSARRGVFR